MNVLKIYSCWHLLHLQSCGDYCLWSLTLVQDRKTLFLYGICSKTLFIEAGSVASYIDDKQGVALSLMINGQLQDSWFICTLKSDKYLHINLIYLWYKMSPLGYIMFCYYIYTLLFCYIGRDSILERL